MTDTLEAAQSARPVDELRTSARGWHGVQLAVLGFIGLCGALQSGSDGSGPGWLQRVAAVLVLAALAVACLATVLVASEAWPVYAGRRPDPAIGGAEAVVRRGGRHLRAGIALTFLAVVLVALATSTSWWPKADQGSDLVEVSTSQGSFCGTLTASDAGSVSLDVAGRSVVVALDRVAGLRPVASCSGG
jgi:hypothetical protein